MPLPLPEFLRTYGELLQGQNGALSRTLFWIVASVTLLAVVFIAGAAVQGVVRWWQRNAERRRKDGGSRPHDPLIRSAPR